ncbi:hypothetical protein F2Q70_00016455 [Brassica cretica]|uniref:Uncharacterized protein n=1 Tax=Brassica cretica TaxID=69181 RepID=A0A8S9HT46_BRACR|nr:hypothetical protein F2Q70_00016455 [Brassica cretica]KAF2600916.1 hypothetical protein F2Q68_00009418 [Brassica cretica]
MLKRQVMNQMSSVDFVGKMYSFYRPWEMDHNDHTIEHQSWGWACDLRGHVFFFRALVILDRIYSWVKPAPTRSMLRLFTTGTQWQPLTSTYPFILYVGGGSRGPPSVMLSEKAHS